VEVLRLSGAVRDGQAMVADYIHVIKASMVGHYWAS